MAYEVVRTWTKIWSANVTTTSVIFTPTATAPTTADSGVIDLTEVAGQAPLAVLARFWVAGSDGNAFAVSCVGLTKNASGLWAGTGLMSCTGAAGTLTGVASYDPINTELWADTLATVSGADGGSGALAVYYSAVDNGIAHVLFQTQGHTLIKFLANKDAATSVDGEYKILREV